MKNFLTPKWMKGYIKIYKEKGLKAAIKSAGWKVFALIFLYYLIRDVTLYILIPYLIAKGVISL